MSGCMLFNEQDNVVSGGAGGALYFEQKRSVYIACKEWDGGGAGG